jgi:ubiquitin-protein ligase
LTNEIRIKEENNKIIEDIYNFIEANKDNKDLLELYTRFNLHQFWIDLLEKYDALDEKYYNTIKQIIEIMIFQNMKFNIPFIREFQTNTNNSEISKQILELLKKVELLKLDTIISNNYVLALKDKQNNNYPYFTQEKHYFVKDAKTTSTFTNPKTPMIIMKHYKVISSSLPLTEESAIFFCQDTDNVSLFKFMVIPNEDTPYKFGCFVFDVYIPPNFPNEPPLVSHSTSRKNNFRFNPNLYACGKVCLSLLGTWGSQSASEKWIPPNALGTGSTLFQVIMSIYSMVFSEDPWYNEPGREKNIENAKENIQALNYNNEIRDGTIKYAIINQLKYPEEGFEEVIKIHFTQKKEKVQKYLIDAGKTTDLNMFNSLF